MRTRIVDLGCAVCAMAERANRSPRLQPAIVAAIVIGSALTADSTIDTCAACEELLIGAIRSHNALQDAKRQALG